MRPAEAVPVAGVARTRWRRRLALLSSEPETATAVSEIDDSLRRAFLQELTCELAPEITLTECRTVSDGQWCAVALARRGVPVPLFHVHRADVDGGIRGAAAAVNLVRSVLLNQLAAAGLAPADSGGTPAEAGPAVVPDGDLQLAATIRALVVAWWNLVAYPPGHPALATALEAAYRRLAELTAADGSLAIGASQKGLLVGGSELRSPHALKLAQALFDRQVAILRIEPGVERAEIDAFLPLLTGDPHDDQAPLADRLADAGVSHIQVQLVDYSAIRVTDEVRVQSERESLQDRIVRAVVAKGSTGESDGLWSDIVRTLLGDPADGEATPHTGAAVADLIAGALREAEARAGRGKPSASETPRSREAALAASLAAAVEAHLTSVEGIARVLAARRTTELVQGLPDSMREGVFQAALRALATDEGAGEALHALSSPFAPDAILRALERLESAGTVLSHHALRLAQTLSALVGRPPGASADPRSAPDPLLAELLVLFREEDIDRYNPAEHESLFERLVVELPGLDPLQPGTAADLGDRVELLGDDVLARHSTWALLELLGRAASPEAAGGLLARLETLYRLFLTSGQLAPAVEIVEAVRRLGEDPDRAPELAAALEAGIGRLAGADVLAALVASLAGASAERMAAARQLVERLGTPAVANLLLLLNDEPNRARRRRIFDLLGVLGPAVIPEATRWLADGRWYVLRNMIVLLRAAGDRTSLPGICLCSRHPDVRVRLAVLKTLLVLEAPDARVLLGELVRDRDPQVAEIAVALAGKHGTADVAVEPLVRLLTRRDPFGWRREVRVRALRALAELGEPAALTRLARLFRARRIPLVALEERRVAFEALASYPESARRPLVAQGLGSRDPEIREICRRLAGPESAEVQP